MLYFRDYARDNNAKLDKHIEDTTAEFNAIEEKWRLKLEKTERVWQQKFDKLVEKFDTSEKKQENEQVLTDYHSMKYNMIIHRLPEDVSGRAWETNLESIEKVQEFFKHD